MATAVTRIKLEEIISNIRYYITRFSIPSVTPSTTSPVYGLDIATKRGLLQGIRISSATGTDYTISLKTHESATDFSIDEIVRIVNIDETGHQEMDLNIPYSNEDEFHVSVKERSFIYLTVVNNSASDPTGTISVEIITEIER